MLSETTAYDTDSCSFCTQSGNPYEVWYIWIDWCNICAQYVTTFKGFCYIVNSFSQKMTYVIFAIIDSIFPALTWEYLYSWVIVSQLKKLLSSICQWKTDDRSEMIMKRKNIDPWRSEKQGKLLGAKAWSWK